MGRRRKKRMSKVVRITPEMYEECRQELEKCCQNAKLSDGKITFTKVFTAEKRKATLFFTDEAWAKMTMLLQEFDKEVAWHGVAYRLDTEGKDEYVITDILVYPQEVSAATVEMDVEKYAKWLMENDEDERFQNIHMQGHSHVRMAPNPSATDITHQEEILAQLDDDNFYIFMIYNKSFSRNIKIYDMKKNILFEDGDVEVKLQSAVTGFDEFIADAKAKVVSKTYTYNQGSYQRPSYQTPTYQQPGTYKGNVPYNPLSPAPVAPVTPASGANPPKQESKKKEKEKRKVQIGAGWHGVNGYEQESLYGMGGQEDDDYPYGYGSGR